MFDVVDVLSILTSVLIPLLVYIILIKSTSALSRRRVVNSIRFYWRKAVRVTRERLRLLGVVRVTKYARMTGGGSSKMNDTGTKMFEFARIKCLKRAARLAIMQEMPSSQQQIFQQQQQYGVPKKRSGHRAVCNDENLWIWGGYCPVEEMSEDEWDMEDGSMDNSANANDDNDNDAQTERSPLFPQLWRFNFATRIWTLLKTTGDVPSKTVASHCALLYGNNTLVVYGGTGFPFGDELTNALYTCNLTTLVWKKHELVGDGPLGLYGSSIVIVDDFLYCLFGTNARVYCSNVYRIDLRTLETTTLFDSISLVENANFIEMEQLSAAYPNEFLFGRYRQEVVHHDHKLYALGGGKIDGDAYGFDILPVFNMKTAKWEFISTLPDLKTNKYPIQRKFHSCIKVDNYIYMFGGMHCDVERNIFTVVDNAMWRLELNELRWQRLMIKMPCLTYFHAACTNNNGEVFFHGGVKTISQDQTCRINHLYKIVLKIPRLADLSWYKLISSYPKLVFVDKQALFRIGVPTSYINRIG